MGELDAAYLAACVLFGLEAFLLPVLYARRYRHFAARLRGSAYERRFRLGWPLLTVGMEIVCICCSVGALWGLHASLSDQVRWMPPWLVACAFGVLCILGGMALTQESFLFLRRACGR